MNQNPPVYPQAQTAVVQPINVAPGQQVYPAVGAPTPVVYAYPAQTPAVVYSDYRSCQSKFTGIIQLIAGICLIAFNATAIGLYASWTVISYGIWGGCMFVITGVFGIIAAKRKTKCTVIAYMILCIIATVFAATVFALGVVGCVVASSDCRTYSYYSYYYYYSYNDCGNPSAVMAMNILITILAAVVFIVALWGSIICCRSGCKGSASQPVPMMIIGNTAYPISAYSVTSGQVIITQAYPAAPGQMVGAPGPMITAPAYTVGQGQMNAVPVYQPLIGDIPSAPAYHASPNMAFQDSNENLSIEKPPIDFSPSPNM